MQSQPLTGAIIVVTRASDQASSLSRALVDLGAEPIEVPTIAIVDPLDGGRALRHALADLAGVDWLVITSPNGAARAVAAASDLALRLRSAGTGLAVVGPGTEAAIARHGIGPDLIPERFVAEGLLDVFPAPPPGGGRALLAQAAGARPVLADGLAAAGWEVETVEAYRTVNPGISSELLARTADAHAIAFTSGSTVRGWVASAGAAATPPVVVSIGPITSAVAREHGIGVAVEADPHTIDGVVAALVAALSALGSAG